MTTTHAAMIEDAAQTLATWLGEDFKHIRMVDHFLGMVSPINDRAAEIASIAAEAMRPALEQIREAMIESALKDHQLASCNAEFRNLADYLRSMPERLPKVGSAHTRGEIQAWFKREIDAAPFGRRAGLGK